MELMVRMIFLTLLLVGGCSNLGRTLSGVGSVVSSAGKVAHVAARAATRLAVPAAKIALVTAQVVSSAAVVPGDDSASIAPSTDSPYEHCYENVCGAAYSGLQCFSTFDAYCDALCLESDCTSQLQCSSECQER